MTNRSPIVVLLLSIVTFGIYGIVWLVSTKTELKRITGLHIPTMWIILIPFASIYLLWKYSEAVEPATQGRTSKGLAFVLLLLLGPIGYAVIQNAFNTQVGVAAPSYSAYQGSPVAQGDASFQSPQQNQRADYSAQLPQKPGSAPNYETSAATYGSSNHYGVATAAAATTVVAATPAVAVANNPQVGQQPVATPEGWYPDYANPNQLRWWDGSQWTDHTHAAN